MPRATPRLQQELVTFLALTVALSSIFYAIIIGRHSLSAGGGLFVLALMWCPGVSALVTRLIFQHDGRGEGWRWGRTRYELAGYLLPLAYAIPAYGAVWLSGFGAVDLGRFQTNPLRFVLLGTLVSVCSATGEELGWRGFLVPKLAEGTTFTRVALVSGIIWSAWHVPLIVFADYNGGTPAAYSIACFVVMVIAISFPLAWLRLRSGSVWPAALLHASHNLYIQGFFDRVTVDTGITEYLTGEFGAALALTTVVTGIIFWRLAAPRDTSAARAPSEVATA